MLIIDAKSSRVPSVDGLRAVAILSVILVHCWTLCGSPVSTSVLAPFAASSFVGVDIFFVLSGFLLFMPWAMGKPLELRAYAARRALRIVPAYYASIVVVLLVWHAAVPPGIGTYPLADGNGRILVASHLALVQSFVVPLRGKIGGLGINGVWWTLTWEAVFYIVLPMVGARYAKRPFLWLAIGALLALDVRFLGLHDPQSLAWMPAAMRNTLVIMGDGFVGYGAHFAAGMTVAWIYVHRSAFGERHRAALFGAGLATMVAAQQWMGRDILPRGRPDFTQISYVAGRPLFAVGFAAVLLAIVFMPRAGRVLGTGPLKWIGDRSYGVYLFHLVIAEVLAHSTGLFEPAGQWSRVFLSFVVVLVLGLGAGAISYAVIEQPAMRLARLWGRRAAPVRPIPRPVAVRLETG